MMLDRMPVKPNCRPKFVTISLKQDRVKYRTFNVEQVAKFISITQIQTIYITFLSIGRTALYAKKTCRTTVSMNPIEAVQHPINTRKQLQCTSNPVNYLYRSLLYTVQIHVFSTYITVRCQQHPQHPPASFKKRRQQYKGSHNYIIIATIAPVLIGTFLSAA